MFLATCKLKMMQIIICKGYSCCWLYIHPIMSISCADTVINRPLILWNKQPFCLVSVHWSCNLVFMTSTKALKVGLVLIIIISASEAPLLNISSIFLNLLTSDLYNVVCSSRPFFASYFGLSLKKNHRLY